MISQPARTIARGDVVGSGGAHALVWQVMPGGKLLVLPIVASGGRNHRGDHAITEFTDMLQCGLGGKDLVIRTSGARLVHSANQTRIGRLSDQLMACAQQACDRECTALAHEAKWQDASRTSAASDLI